MRKLLLLSVGLCLLIAGGCVKGDREKSDSVKVSPVAKVDSVKKFPLTPDQVLFDIEGDIAYIVCERFDGDSRSASERDSVSFSPEGSLIGMVKWSGSGRDKYEIYNIRLKYNADGEFEQGEDAANKLPVLIERNDSLQIVKLGRVDKEDSPENMGFTWQYDWEGLLPVRKMENYQEYEAVRRYKYEGDSRSPVSMTCKMTDMEGVVQDECSVEYVEYDDRGNWTKRRVTVKSSDYGYDVESGKVVKEGAKKVSRYTECRRIGYRERIRE